MYCPSTYDIVAEIVEEMDVEPAEAMGILASLMDQPDDDDEFGPSTIRGTRHELKQAIPSRNRKAFAAAG